MSSGRSTKLENTQSMAEKPSDVPDIEPVDSVASGSVDMHANSDDVVLAAQGHKAAMPRLFSALSSVGFMFCIMNSWVGSLSTFGQNLRYGGPQVVIFAMIVAIALQWIVALGLSELASAFPSSGGQYHFMYMMAPEKYKRFSAYVTGWMTILAWWLATTSGLSQVAIASTGLAAFAYPDYTPQAYHIYLCFLGMAFIAVTPLFLFSKSIPGITSTSMFLSLTGFFVWFVCMLAMRQATNPGSLVTQSNLGASGWNQGTAWVLGVANAMYCFAGADSAIHIAEEIQHPGRKLPVVINLTMFIGAMTGLPMMVAAMFTTTDYTKVMNAGFPAIELIYQATGHRELTMFLGALLILVMASAMPPQFVASGRIAWAFARDGGLPYSNYFSHVDTRMKFPARATLLALAFIGLYGLLYLASSTAFNSILTSAVLFSNMTLAIPQTLLLLVGREALPERPFNLGRVGTFCNVIATLWVPVLIILVCMPPSLPVTVKSMNYTSPILVGISAIIIGGWYTGGRHRFEGPRINWELLNIGNQMEARGDNVKA